MISVLLDTSVLMEYENILDKITAEYKVYISIITLQELDHLKANCENSKRIRAQRAIKNIREKMNANIIEILTEEYNDYYSVTNDDKIIFVAKKLELHLYTLDINMEVKAKANGIHCITYKFSEDIYKGYRELLFSVDKYNEFYSHKEDYYDSFYTNEYIIIKDISNNEIFDVFRFTGDSLLPLKLPSSKIIKGKNVLQRCALDMLNNNDITICAILGQYGSGKTFLCLQSALNSINNTGKQSKILGVREAVGEGKEIGYLKGTFEDKTQMFFLPIQHSLQGGEFELQNYIHKGQFDFQIPYYMKGTTYNNSIIVVDEAEDLTERQIRLIGTRLGENSRIFFSGDYKQAVNDSTTHNPLVRMCQELKGKPEFACIYLDDDVRSGGSKIFANLFQN